MTIWLGGVCLMTWAFLRDGGFNQFDPVLELCVVGLFWLFGCAGAAGMFGMPLTHVTFTQGMVHIHQRWLLKHQRQSFAINHLPAPEIRQRKDSDGAPYYTLVLAAGGRDVVLKEGACKPDLDALRDRLISEARFQT
jgi:hypothetical protein